MPSHPQESDRAASDPVEPAPVGAAHLRTEICRNRAADPTGSGARRTGTDAAAPALPRRVHGELQELEDRWRRAARRPRQPAQASRQELERERTAERSRTAAAFLPVLDNLELALTHAGSIRADRGRGPGGARPGGERAGTAWLPAARGDRRRLRPGPARSGRSRTGSRRARARSSRCCALATETANGSSARRRDRRETE